MASSLPCSPTCGRDRSRRARKTYLSYSTTERQRSGTSMTPTERAAAASAGMASTTTTRFAPGSPRRKRRRRRLRRPILTSRPMPCFCCRLPVCACFRVIRRDGIMNTRSNINHNASPRPMTRPREVSGEWCGCRSAVASAYRYRRGRRCPRADSRYVGRLVPNK